MVPSGDLSEARWNAVFLHGALGSAAVFGPLIDYLRKSSADAFGDCAAVDLPGHGDASDVRLRYTPEALADYVMKEVPDPVLSRSTVVVAQSFAGIAATVLPGFSESIVGVVLLDTPLRSDAAEVSVYRLASRYVSDPRSCEWIPRLLEDYFGYSVDGGYGPATDYMEYIEKCPVPIAMVTGSERLVKAHTKVGGRPKVIAGSLDQIIQFARGHDAPVDLAEAPACFGIEDLELLKAREIKTFEIHTLQGLGHNVLNAESVNDVGAIISGFSQACLGS